MPKEWAWCRLGVLSETTDYIANGSFADTKANVKFYKDKNYALLVKTQDFNNNFTEDLTYTDEMGYNFLSKSHLFGGELLLSNIGASIGKALIVPKFDIPMAVAPNSIVVRTTNLLETHFLKSIMLSTYGQTALVKFTAGSAMPKFNKTQLRSLLIPLPSISVQKSIISIIDNIFEIIQSIDNNKDELEICIKQTKSKILDLAIHGKLVPQDPNDEPAEELLKRISTSDNRPYKKFELVDDSFKIPNGWIATQMGTYIEFTGGAQPPKETFEYNKTANNIRLIQIRDYKTNDFATYIPKNLARRICSESDIMIGRYGPPLFQILRGIEGAYNVALMKAESKVFCKDYLFYMLQDEKLLHFLESLSDRTCGQDGVNMYELKRYPILVPPLAEQQRIVSKIEELFSYLDTISSNLE